MITPKDFVGPLMDLAQNRRGEFVDMTYLTELRCSLVYNMPLAEVVTDFFDELKSKSRGYASMEYSITGYRRASSVSRSSISAVVLTPFCRGQGERPGPDGHQGEQRARGPPGHDLPPGLCLPDRQGDVREAQGAHPQADVPASR